jgi:hypothetical protein
MLDSGIISACCVHQIFNEMRHACFVVGPRPFWYLPDSDVAVYYYASDRVLFQVPPSSSLVFSVMLHVVVCMRV